MGAHGGLRGAREQSRDTSNHATASRTKSEAGVRSVLILRSFWFSGFYPALASLASIKSKLRTVNGPHAQSLPNKLNKLSLLELIYTK